MTMPHAHTPEEERAVVPQDGPSCYICLLTDLSARLAEVEAERDAAIQEVGKWSLMCGAAEAREKAKDEAIRKAVKGCDCINDGTPGYCSVCEGLLSVLSTPSPSQPVKVAEPLWCGRNPCSWEEVCPKCRADYETDPVKVAERQPPCGVCQYQPKDCADFMAHKCPGYRPPAEKPLGNDLVYQEGTKCPTFPHTHEVDCWPGRPVKVVPYSGELLGKCATGECGHDDGSWCERGPDKPAEKLTGTGDES